MNLYKHLYLREDVWFRLYIIVLVSITGLVAYL